MELALAEVSWIRGRVIFADSKPGARTYVSNVRDLEFQCSLPGDSLPDCWPKSRPILAAWTDEQGWFSIPVPAGRYQLGVAKDHSGPQ